MQIHCNHRVSPGNSSKRNGHPSTRRSGRQQWMIAMEDSIRHGNGTVTTQTTLVSIQRAFSIVQIRIRSK